MDPFTSIFESIVPSFQLPTYDPGISAGGGAAAGAGAGASQTPSGIVWWDPTTWFKGTPGQFWPSNQEAAQAGQAGQAVAKKAAQAAADEIQLWPFGPSISRTEAIKLAVGVTLYAVLLVGLANLVHPGAGDTIVTTAKEGAEAIAA